MIPFKYFIFYFFLLNVKLYICNNDNKNKSTIKSFIQDRNIENAKINKTNNLNFFKLDLKEFQENFRSQHINKINKKKERDTKHLKFLRNKKNIIHKTNKFRIQQHRRKYQ